MSLSSVELWQKISAAGLAAPMICRSWAAEALQGMAASDATDAEKILAQLVKIGRLTNYQADLIAGKREGEFKRGAWTLLQPVTVPLWENWFEVNKTATGPVSWMRWLDSESLETLRTAAPSLPRGLRLAQIQGSHLQAVSVPELIEKQLQLQVEPLAGVPLSIAVQSQPQLSEQATMIVRQIAKALQPLHAAGIAHGRILPDRIFWDAATNQATLARDPLCSATATNDPTATGVVSQNLAGLATTQFIAPEFLMPGQQPTVSTDIYSLGCTWWWLVTGRPLVAGSTPEKQLGRQAEASLAIPKDCTLAAPYVRVLQHALAKNLPARFPTADALCQALDAAAAVVAKGQVPRAKVAIAAARPAAQLVTQTVEPKAVAAKVVSVETAEPVSKVVEANVIEAAAAAAKAKPAEVVKPTSELTAKVASSPERSVAPEQPKQAVNVSATTAKPEKTEKKVSAEVVPVEIAKQVTQLADQRPSQPVVQATTAASKLATASQQPQPTLRRPVESSAVDVKSVEAKIVEPKATAAPVSTPQSAVSPATPQPAAVQPATKQPAIKQSAAPQPVAAQTTPVQTAAAHTTPTTAAQPAEQTVASQTPIAQTAATQPTAVQTAGAQPAATKTPTAKTAGRKKSAASASTGAKRKSAKRQKSNKWMLPVVGGFGFVSLVLFILLLSGGLNFSSTEPEPVVNQNVANIPTTDVAPEIKERDPRLEHYRIVSSGKETLWAPPAAPTPLALDLLPPGGQMFVSIHPKTLLASAPVKGLLAAVDEDISPWLAQITKRSGQPLESINQCTAAFYGENEQAITSLRVTLAQPQPLSALKAAWGNPAEEKVGAQTLLTNAAGDSYYIAAQPLTDAQSVTEFSVGPSKLMREVAESEGVAGPLITQMEKLWQVSDVSADVCLLFAPSFLFSEGKSLLATAPKRLNSQIKEVLGTDVRAALFQTRMDPQWYLEVQAIGRDDRDTSRISAELRQRIEGASGAIEEWFVSESPHPYWRQLALRFPQMLRSFAEQSRFGIEGGVAIANTWLPKEAGPNVVLASWISLQDGATLASDAVETSVAAAPTAAKPLTVDEYLGRAIKLSFDQEPIEVALRLIGEEANANLPPGTPTIRFELDGGAFEKAGITRNQQVREFMHVDKPVRDALTVLAKRGNPVTTVTDTRDKDQRLIWVVRDDPMNAGQKLLSLTTRDAATTDSIPLPVEFAPAN